MKHFYKRFTLVFLLSFSLLSCKNEHEFFDIDNLKSDTQQIINEITTKLKNKNQIAEIKLINIDCTKVDSLLNDAQKTDQNSRKGIDTGVDDIDGKNQQTVVSIIEKCGWPSSRENIFTAWVILQHSNSELMSNYYAQLKESENKGLIDASTLALMEDRLLMNNGYPQLYGSQLRDNKLYKLKDAKNINIIRQSIGLESIEDYMKRFGLEFKIEDYQ